MNDRVRVHVDGSLAYVTLTRADKHNGMDTDMLKGVLKAQRQLRKMKQIRTVILQGEGPSFCAGLDVASVLGDPVKAATAYLQLWLPFRNNFQRWSMG